MASGDHRCLSLGIDHIAKPVVDSVPLGIGRHRCWSSGGIDLDDVSMLQLNANLIMKQLHVYPQVEMTGLSGSCQPRQENFDGRALADFAFYPVRRGEPVLAWLC
jgi:hypothetical protein